MLSCGRLDQLGWYITEVIHCEKWVGILTWFPRVRLTRVHILKAHLEDPSSPQGYQTSGFFLLLPQDLHKQEHNTLASQQYQERSRASVRIALTLAVRFEIYDDGLHRAFPVLSQTFPGTPSHLPHEKLAHPAGDGCRPQELILNAAG